MAKLSSISRIGFEELQGDADQKWFTFLQLLNLFVKDHQNAINKDLTIDENVDGQVTTIRFKTNETYPLLSGWKDIKFGITMKRRPSGCLVFNINNVNNASEVFVDTVSANVKFNPPTATIKYITGLQPCTTYDITLLVM